MAAPTILACEGIKPLEKIYCQIQTKGQGANLPRFDEFQRNPELTQRLLLKRPAAKAGLTLPPESSSRTVQPKNTPHQAPAKTAINPPPNTLGTSTTKPQPPSNFVKQAPLAGAGDFNRCQMRATSIGCDAIAYMLQDNRNNKALAANALTDTNQLLLKPAPTNTANIHPYLREAYATYLLKMMDIGLAGVTLTYSKFYYIYEDVTANKKDFSARFKEMYFYLKKDKSTMAVSRQHANKAPPSLGACDFITQDLIACDNEGANWIYRR
ncbi:MAG: hypothetical protein U5M23_01210 [Marinagarivorans sp.]|nr:hypothetical protein [Marinagarivorans sp.]